MEDKIPDLDFNNQARFSRKTILSAVTVILLLISIPLGVYLAGQKQIFKPKAFEKNTKSVILSNLDQKSLPYEESVNSGLIQPAGQILEVSLFYSELPKPTFKPLGLKKKNGYAPKINPAGKTHTLEVLNKLKKVIYTLDFDIPNEIKDPPPLSKQSKEKIRQYKLKQMPFALTIPWLENGSILTIKDRQGTVISSFNYIPASIPVSNNKPKFKTIKGSDFLASQNTIIKETIKPNESQYLDIVLLGDDYTNEEMDKFHSDVNRFIGHLLTYEPFKSRASQVLFHFIDNTDDLGCNNDGRVLWCDVNKVIQRVNDSGVPYEQIGVIVDTGIYGGGGGVSNISVSYNGDYGQGVFVHEFGHSFGALWDEYIYDYDHDGPIDNQVYTNCYSGLPPALVWQNLVALGDYSEGCSYRNWYRSSDSSIMIDVWGGGNYYNAVSQVFLNNSLDYFAGVFTDNVNPTSTITFPANGETVKGTINVKADMNDDRGVVRSELWKDGLLYQTIYVSPAGFSWKTTRDQNGSHTIQVKGYDTKGNIGVSELLNVVVDNPPDTVPPQAFMNYPFEGSVVRGLTVVGGGSDDNVEVVRFEIYLDDQLLRSTPFSYLSFNWDSKTVPEGRHWFYAKAYDSVGNVGQSQTVNVTVEHLDKIPPIVSIYYPYDGSILPPAKFAVSANANDDYGISKVEFYIDNQLLATDSEGPYEAIWDTSVYPNGSSHTLYAKAYDTSGNIGVSPVLNVIVKDIIMPSAITDLSVPVRTSDSVTLAWTAPGDDWTDGTATTYDIRYSTTFISSEADWDAATQIQDEPIPQPAGTNQSYIVLGLTPGTFYSFAIKSIDDVGLVSYLSNIGVATTLPPILTPTPTPIPIPKACLDVITYARNSETRACKQFPTSCLPESWALDPTCNLPTTPH